MYSFVFYFIYNYALNLKNKDPRFVGVMAVVWGQINLIFAIDQAVKRFVGMDLIQGIFGPTLVSNKIYTVAIFGIWIVIMNFWFDEARRIRITERWGKERPIFTARNAILCVIIIFLPLPIFIMLLNFGR